jgi:hypothetical protein
MDIFDDSGGWLVVHLNSDCDVAFSKYLKVRVSNARDWPVSSLNLRKVFE